MWHYFYRDFTPPSRLVATAKEMVESFTQANSRLVSRVENQEPIVHKWHKPSTGWIKLNWDAAIYENSKMIMGVGVYSGER
jgi:hypothetical protein